MPARPRRAALLCYHFARNLACYRAGWNAKKFIFPESEIWATINSNFLDIAVLEWCKLFADNKAYHSWRKVVVDPESFLPQLISDFGAKHKDWDLYLIKMRTYRDKFLAHLDREKRMHPPPMDLAEFATRYLYDTMRAEQNASIFNELPDDLKSYGTACKSIATNLYQSAT